MRFRQLTGRKAAILLSLSSFLASTIVASTTQSFGHYAVAIVLWGFNYSTQNGACQALLYESLEEDGHVDAFARVNGLNMAGFWLVMFGAVTAAKRRAPVYAVGNPVADPALPPR